MPSDLVKEIDELKNQIANFKAAIAALEKPGTTPTGNSLADILQARFSKLDSDAEREKSLKTARTLLEEVKNKLEARQKHKKRIGNLVNTRKSGMSGTGRQINRLAGELQNLLNSLKGDEIGVSEQWKELNGNTPMIDWQGKVVLPKFEETPGRDIPYRITALDSEQD